MLDDDELYEYFEDEDDIIETGYAEQQLYERYLSASMAGKRYVLPQDRVYFGQMYQRCVHQMMFERGENGMSTCAQLGLLMGSCLIVLFTSCMTFLPRYTVPLSSLFFGSLAIHTFFGEDHHLIYWVIAFTTIVYCFMYYTHNVLRKTGIGFRVGCLCFTLILLVQFLLSDKAFLRIRGVLMIITMKLFSLGADLEVGEVRNTPGVIDFYAYSLGINSVMFGPWIPYKEHAFIMKQKLFKGLWKTIWKGIYTYVVAFMCLLHSSCFLEWLIPDDWEYYSTWLIAFRDAMSFRYSHYFVCYTAEAGLYLSGYLAIPADDDEEEDEGDADDGRTRNRRPTGTTPPTRDTTALFGRRIVRALNEADDEYPVTNALFVELPRSLVDVVVNWNIPMHLWLKKYVFNPTKDDVGYFWAVFFTYTVSSILHGFNFQISTVLLSLGIYTYAEHVLREKLSKAFNACILARRCRRGCGHVYDGWNFYVMVANFLFFLLAVFHLTYLGMVFDSSEIQEEGYNVAHTLRKWSRMNFASHYIALGMLVFAKII